MNFFCVITTQKRYSLLCAFFHQSNP